MIVDSKDPAEKGIDVTLGTEVIVSMTVRELRAIIRALSLTVRAGTGEAESCVRLAGHILLAREEKLVDMQHGNERLMELVMVSNISNVAPAPPSAETEPEKCPVCGRVRGAILSCKNPCYKCCEVSHGKDCRCSACHEENR